jgi:replication factor A1
MAIKDLQARQSNVDIIVDVVDVGTPRDFQKFGKPGKVANATVKDETGAIKLTLWNDEIGKVKKGIKLHIINGYVSEWQGEKQLTTGRFGKMEVVGEGAETLDEAEEETLLDDKKKDTGEKVLTKDEKVESDVLDEEFDEETVEEDVTDDEAEDETEEEF